MSFSSALPRGFTFSPPDADLISAYLRPRIAHQTLPEHAAKFLHHADVYAADPATLISAYLPAVLPSRKNNGEEMRCWYFFGSTKAKSGRDRRRIRMVGGDKGTWHSEKGKEVVSDGQGPVGYKQKFTYKPSNADGSGEAVWLMVEFGVNDLGDDETGQVPVLCKVYQSPRKPRSASTSTTTPAYKRERNRKHKATDDDSSPVTTTARCRLFIPNPPAAPAPTLPPEVEPRPELPAMNDDYLDGVSLEQLLQDLMADQGLGDYLSMPFSESQSNCSFSMADQAGSMDQTTTLNRSFLPCSPYPYAGISASWTRGDTTDDEAASINCYVSAPSSPAIPAEWMMQPAFATTYQFGS